MPTVRTGKHLLLESTTKSVEPGTYDVICQLCTVKGMVVESEVLKARKCDLSKFSLPMHPNVLNAFQIILINHSEFALHDYMLPLTPFFSPKSFTDAFIKLSGNHAIFYLNVEVCFSTALSFSLLSTLS